MTNRPPNRVGYRFACLRCYSPGLTVGQAAGQGPGAERADRRWPDLPFRPGVGHRPNDERVSGRPGPAATTMRT